MDILDIDEMLKDDSFHFLEEKNPDDVSNIIQQWKNQQQQEIHPLQQQNENKLDSRTFTRPKRRSAAQKLESQFLNIANASPESQLQQQQTQVTHAIQRQMMAPVLNVQIGGQIRTPLSARSMLHDTSPPSSICSMDASIDNTNMNNSLITSADFTHLNFLLSTPSLEANMNFNFNEQNCAGYTLNDMIRDRKALESLTLSADDGTLIKDSQISQIDDISLSLLKGSSGCNSMANSAESFEGSHFGFNAFNDRTIQILRDRNSTLEVNGESNELRALHRTMMLNNENSASDTTFTCLENGQSFIISRHQPSEKCAKTVTEDPKNSIRPQNAEFPRYQQIETAVTESFDENNGDIASMKLKTTPFNETMCIRRADETTNLVNETYNCQPNVQDLPQTPEKVDKDKTSAKMYESTPHDKTYTRNKHSYTPAIRKIIEDPNISPIIPIDTTNQLQAAYSPKPAVYNGSPVSHLAESELLENVENPNITYNRRSRLRQKELDDEREQRHKNTIELQDIMDLAQAEAELLNTANDGDDDDVQQFEHMLDELGRIKLNPDQLKMQKSLEKIKKRFNCTLNQTQEQDAGSVKPFTSTSSSEYSSGLSNTFTSETRQETLRKLRDTLRSNDTTTEMSGTSSHPTDLASSGSVCTIGNSGSSSFIVSSMATSGCSSSERLLARRTRLNDDINLTSTKELPLNPETKGNIAMKNQDDPTIQDEVISETNAAIPKTGSETAKYKLSEQRERDRDRFKTIKIVRNRNEDDESATQAVLNVPCIDDDDSEIQLYPKNEKSATPNRVSRCDPGNSDKGSTTNRTTKVTTTIKPSEARSLSRPRYLSGLQKFSVVSKAISAGDLKANENNPQTTAETKTSQLSRMYDAKRSNMPPNPVKPANTLKSPMGVKAKSLHNLVYSNLNFAPTAAGAIAQTRVAAFGLRKINSGGFGFDSQRVQKLQTQSTQSSQTKTKPSDGFKKPQPMSATNRITAGIARPSSGYYSLNVTTKTDIQQGASNPVSAIETEESMQTKMGNIPKPSGIRPPNKRSGLPRPASMVRR